MDIAATSFRSDESGMGEFGYKHLLLCPVSALAGRGLSAACGVPYRISA
jgi:hypothetical protein